MPRRAEAMRPDGRLLILSGVGPDDEPDGREPQLLMMVLVGGKGRTLGGFRILARGAGLEIAAAGRQPDGRYIVECRPA